MPLAQHPQAPSTLQVLTVQAAAARAGVHQCTIQKWAAAGNIRRTSTGHYDAVSLDRYLHREQSPPGPQAPALPQSKLWQALMTFLQCELDATRAREERVRNLLETIRDCLVQPGRNPLSVRHSEAVPYTST